MTNMIRHFRDLEGTFDNHQVAFGFFAERTMRIRLLSQLVWRGTTFVTSLKCEDKEFVTEPVRFDELAGLMAPDKQKESKIVLPMLSAGQTFGLVVTDNCARDGYHYVVRAYWEGPRL